MIAHSHDVGGPEIQLSIDPTSVQAVLQTLLRRFGILYSGLSVQSRLGTDGLNSEHCTYCALD